MGQTAKLGTNMYDLSGHTQVDQYTYTTLRNAEYVGANYTYGADIKFIVNELQDPIFVEPRNLDTSPKPTETQKLIHAKKITNFIKQKDELMINKVIAYSFVWGQCTEAMRAKLKGFQTLNTIKRSSNVIKLLKLI